MTHSDRPPSFTSPPPWIADSVFYQVFPDRFARGAASRVSPRFESWDSPPTVHGFKGGDLDGIVERLDYLADLGVTALYLNPIFASACNHRYHTFDYYAVDPLLGGEPAFDRLLAAAHARGIRVVLDGVFNHASRGFFAFHHLLECGADSPYRDWFHVRDWPIRAYDSGRPPNYEAWWGLPALPKFNTANREVRDFLLGVAEHWAARGIDGWRLDVPQEIHDAEFWREFRRRVRAARADAYLVGEIWDTAPEWLEGDRFDGLMNYPLGRLILGFCLPDLDTTSTPGGRTLRRFSAPQAKAELESLLESLPSHALCSQLNLLGSHDTPRILTLARGDRSAIWNATLLQMTLPGAPCIYYGDEIGLEGGEDPDCRRSFPWEAERWDGETRDVFRRAIALRASMPSLRSSRLDTLASDAGVLAFLRHADGSSCLVAINVSNRQRRCRWRFGLPAGVALEEKWDGAAPPPRITRVGTAEADVEIIVGGRTGRVLEWSVVPGR